MYNQVTISSGHSINCQGASDIINEVTEAVKVTNRVYDIIKSSGKACYKYHDTSNSSTSNLVNIVNCHNNIKEGVDVSIHFNAYSHVDKPMGVEVCYYSDPKLASEMSYAISKAGGFINRGAKQRTGLYFLKHTVKPAILIEVCFVDSVKDVELYRANFESICQAIAKTLIGSTPIQNEPQKPIVSAPSQPVTSNNSKPNIKKIQQLCNNVLNAGLVVDGIWGPKTDVAVSRLPLCGIPYTQRACTKFVQEVLGISVDGIFYTGTASAVKKFQQNKGLTTDGIVGKNTYKALANK